MNSQVDPEKFPFSDPALLKRAAVICHRNADADAYLSAVAVSNLIKAMAPSCEVDVVAPEGMTVLTGKLSKKFVHKVVEESLEEYDLYVAVDVGDAELLKGWKDKLALGRGMRVLIDHHPLRDRSIYDHVVVDEKATSAAEVVFGLFEDLKIIMDKVTAQGLLEALLFDSSHLAIATSDTLRTAVRLLDLGADIAEAKRDLRSEPDYGEVLAKLKGAKRLKVFKCGTWVVATSSVGSFQAHVARALLSLGADVSVVGGETDGETRVSMRATQRFADRTGVQLGVQIAEPTGKSLGGHGGGHSTAASFSATVDEDDAVKTVLKRLAGILGAETKELD